MCVGRPHMRTELRPEEIYVWRTYMHLERGI